MRLHTLLMRGISCLIVLDIYRHNSEYMPMPGAICRLAIFTLLFRLPQVAHTKELTCKLNNIKLIWPVNAMSIIH